MHILQEHNNNNNLDIDNHLLLYYIYKWNILLLFLQDHCKIHNSLLQDLGHNYIHKQCRQISLCLSHNHKNYNDQGKLSKYFHQVLVFQKCILCILFFYLNLNNNIHIHLHILHIFHQKYQEHIQSNNLCNKYSFYLYHIGNNYNYWGMKYKYNYLILRNHYHTNKKLQLYHLYLQSKHHNILQ